MSNNGKSTIEERIPTPINGPAAGASHNKTIQERIPTPINGPAAGASHNKTIEERISVREEIKILEEDIKKLKDNIEGKEKWADSEWRRYKKTGYKKYFIGAGKKYKECNEMKGALRDLEREKEFYQNKWNRLKKAA